MDFEADLSAIYKEIRRYMAVDFPEDLGPKNCSGAGKSTPGCEQRGILRLSAILVVFYLATAQLSPSAPNSIIAIALGTILCM